MTHRSSILAMFVTLCVFVCPSVSTARVHGSPLKFHLVDVRSEAGVTTWTIEAIAGRTGQLAALQIEGGAFDAQGIPSAWQVMVLPDAPLTFTLQATDRGTEATCIARYEFDGQPYWAHLVLPVSLETSAGALVPAPGPPPSSVPTMSDYPAIEPANIFDELGAAIKTFTNQLQKPGILKKPPRDVTVYGKVVYQRSDTVMTAGAAKATVWVYDDDFVFDKYLGSAITNWDGTFSVSFKWAQCIVCETDPDIYIHVRSENSRVQVKRDNILEPVYKWDSGVTNNYSGTSLNVGNVQPGDVSEHPALHILTNMTRTHRWLNDRGYDTQDVDVKWPSGEVAGTHYNPVFKTIHIEDEGGSAFGNAQWHEVTQSHEYGHHVHKSFGDFSIPTYFDPHCGIDGHCGWCSENESAAFTEGWAEWFSDAVTRSYKSTYGYASLSDDDAEFIQECFEDGFVNSAWTTEGILAALIRDIEDGVINTSYNEDDPESPIWRDQVALGTDEILAVFDLDEPTTAREFLESFLARYPSNRCDLWETARNNLFEMDDTPPGAVTGLDPGPVGPPLACLPPRDWVEFSWVPPSDDWSCAGGYSVLIAATAQLPDNIEDIGAVTEHTTPCLMPGSYYFNIRAHDRAGHWSNEYASYFFEFYGPPVLVLTAERSGPDVHLTWTSGDTQDRSDYVVYRGTTAGVAPISQNYVAAASDIAFVDASAPASTLYYIVVANDGEGNRSALSNEASVRASSDERDTPALTAFTVRQNFPNPFSTSTELEIGLVAESGVAIDVFDVAGRHVASLPTRTLGAGWQRVVLDNRDGQGRALPSGVYFYRVRGNGSEVVRKMVITR